MGKFNDALRWTLNEDAPEIWLRACESQMEDIEYFFEHPDETHDEPSTFEFRQKFRELLAKHGVYQRI